MLLALSAAESSCIALRGHEYGRLHRSKIVEAGFCIFVALGLIPPLEAQSSPQEDAQVILQKNCVSCHGSGGISGLDVRDRAAILKGGTRGPAIVPGNAEQSLLYKAVTKTGDLKMPPGKTALPPAQIDAIRSWIDTGASWNTRAVAVTEPS